MIRLSTGIHEFDRLIERGIPQGFFVALTGEPGTGKTIFSLSFIHEGLVHGAVSYTHLTLPTIYSV